MSILEIVGRHKEAVRKRKAETEVSESRRDAEEEEEAGNTSSPIAEGTSLA